MTREEEAILKFGDKKYVKYTDAYADIICSQCGHRYGWHDRLKCQYPALDGYPLQKKKEVPQIPENYCPIYWEV